MISTIDLYKVGKVLGRGGYGKVNLGLQRLTRKLVAIKSMRLEDLVEVGDMQQVVAEIQILQSLKHENHIKLFETMFTENHICIVMELCPGGDLLSYLKKRRKIPEVNAKYIFK